MSLLLRYERHVEEGLIKRDEEQLRVLAAPDGLYKNGLQRARFLPAIKLIKRRTRAMELGAGISYRLRTLKDSALYCTTCPSARALEWGGGVNGSRPDKRFGAAIPCGC